MYPSLQGLLWSGGWVGLSPCDSIMSWVGLGDVKWTHVHLWASSLVNFLAHSKTVTEHGRSLPGFLALAWRFCAASGERLDMLSSLGSERRVVFCLRLTVAGLAEYLYTTLMCCSTELTFT